MILDHERGDAIVMHCDDAQGAAVVAGLLNGDLSALASATPETLSQCRNAIGCVLRIVRPYGRPFAGVALFPQF